jgi:hypothetical protein
MSEQPVSPVRLFDPGLQPERTALAWRRTALSLTIGALIALRILPPVLGVWSIAAGLAGVAGSALIWILATRRSRRTHHALISSTGPLPDGRLLVLVSALVAGGAILGLLYVILLLRTAH